MENLISYDCDKIFRIWIQESNGVTLSRDFHQFQEKITCCAAQVKLPFQKDQEDTE